MVGTKEEEKCPSWEKGRGVCEAKPEQIREGYPKPEGACSVH